MTSNAMFLAGLFCLTCGILTKREVGFVVRLLERLSVHQCIFVSDSPNVSTVAAKSLSEHFLLSTFIDSERVLFDDYPNTHLKSMVILKMTDVDVEGIMSRGSGSMELCQPLWLVFCASISALSSLNVPYNCELYAAIDNGVNITVYDIYTLGEEIIISLVGYWSPLSGLSFSTKDFFLRRIDVKGQELRRYPFQGNAGSQQDLVDAQSEIIDGFVMIMNFSSKIITYDEAMSDGYDLNENPVILDNTNAIGPTIDIVVNMYLKKQLESLRYYFIRPFHPLVWGVILGWICFASLCLLVTYLFLTPLRSFTRTIEVEATVPLDAFCGQDGSRISSSKPSSSVRIIKIMCRAVAWIVVPAYSASIVSFMAVRLPFVPFNDLKGLTENQQYKLGGLANTFQVTFFENSEDPIVIVAKNRNLVPDEEQPRNLSEGVTRMCADNLFVFMGYSGIIPNLKPPCQVIQIKKPVTKQLVGFSAFPNLTYIQAFKKLMLRFHSSGVINRRQKRIDVRVAPDDDLISDNAIEAVALNLVADMFVIIGVGAVLSVVFLSFEYAMWNYTWRAAGKPEVKKLPMEKRRKIFQGLIISSLELN